jgi:hypothetical protein
LAQNIEKVSEKETKLPGWQVGFANFTCIWRAGECVSAPLVDIMACGCDDVRSGTIVVKVDVMSCGCDGVLSGTIVVKSVDVMACDV